MRLVGSISFYGALVYCSRFCGEKSDIVDSSLPSLLVESTTIEIVSSLSTA